MKAVVTGASGFIGANLARRLIKDGHDVHLLVRFLDSWRLQEVSGQSSIHEVDIRNKSEVKRIVGEIRPDTIFHLAAFGAYSSQTGIEEMTSTNLLGCVSMLEAGLAAGTRSFINAGSSSEYGYKDHPPDENERVEPNSHYAITKSAATHYCQFVSRQADVHAATLRFYSIYGPYEEPTRLIPTLLTHGLEGSLPNLVSPHTARDFVYVDDAVDAMLLTASRPDAPRGSIYNVCTGIQSELREVVALVQDLLPVKCDPIWSSMEQRAWDTSRWVGSPAHIQKTLGWRSTVDLREGLKRTISWLREHPRWLNFYNEARRAQGS